MARALEGLVVLSALAQAAAQRGPALARQVQVPAPWATGDDGGRWGGGSPPVLGRPGGDECAGGPVPYEYYEVPNHCCTTSCEWVFMYDTDSWAYNDAFGKGLGENATQMCPGLPAQNRSCIVQGEYCECAAAVGPIYEQGDPDFEVCASLATHDGYPSCTATPDMTCHSQEDGLGVCRPKGEFVFSLITGLAPTGVRLTERDIAQDELQALSAMALLGIQDFNTNRTGLNCGISLRLGKVFSDDEGSLSTYSFWTHASTIDMSGVSLRRMSMLYALLGSVHSFGRSFVSAGITSDALWDDKVYEDVFPVSQRDQVLARALCAVLERLDLKAVSIMKPRSATQDATHRATAIAKACPRARLLESLAYPSGDAGPEAEGFVTELRDSLSNVFIAVGPAPAMFDSLIPLASEAGKLGSRSQWVFLDPAVRHELEAAGPDIQAALSGSLVLDHFSTDAEMLKDVLESGWRNLSVPNIDYESAFGGSGFSQASFDAFTADFDPFQSEYVRTLGASLYDSISVMGRRVCDAFGNVVPGQFAGLRKLLVSGDGPTLQGLTGLIEYGPNRARISDSANVSVLSLVPGEADNGGAWSLQPLGVWSAATDTLSMADDVGKDVADISEICPRGTYGPADPRHACCGLCAESSSICTAAEACNVIESGTACRCEASNKLRTVVLAESTSALARGVASAQEEFAARRGVFQGLSCDKQLDIVFEPATDDTTAQQMIGKLAGHLLGGTMSPRVDAVMSPARFDLAEAAGILVAGSRPFLVAHPAERFAQKDIAGSLVQVPISFHHRAYRLCEVFQELGFSFSTVIFSNDGESLDYATAHKQACASLDVKVLSGELTGDPAADVAWISATRINVHVLALRCSDPAFAPTLRQAVQAGIAAEGTAWALPLYDQEECNRLDASLRETLHGAIHVGAEYDVEDIAFDSLSVFIKAACAVAPVGPVESSFASEVMAEVRKTAFEGVTGSIAFTDLGTRVLDSDPLLCNVLVGEGGALELHAVQDTSVGALRFAGGAEAVPSDTVLPEPVLVTAGFVWGLNIALAVLAFLTGLTSLAWTIVNRAHPVVKVAQFPFLVVVILGSLLQSIAIALLSVDGRYGVDTASLACRAQMWTMALGFDLTFAPMIVRLYRVSVAVKMTMHKKSKATKPVSSTKAALAVVSFCAVDIAALTTLSIGEHRMVFQWAISEADEYGKPTTMTGLCYTSAPDLFIAILLYHLVVLMIGAYVCWGNEGISSAFSDHRALANTIVTVLQVQSVAVPVLFMVGNDPSPRAFAHAMIIFLTVMPTLAWVFGTKVLYMRGRIKDEGFGNQIIKQLTEEQSTRQKHKVYLSGDGVESSVDTQANRTGPTNKVSPSDSDTISVIGGAASVLSK